MAAPVQTVMATPMQAAALKHSTERPRIRRRSKGHSSRSCTNRSDISEGAASSAPPSDPGSSATWEPGEPVPPDACLPLRVQIAARVLTIMAINSTEETYSARFSLHLRWVDRYYQLPRAPEGEGLFVQDGRLVSKKQIVHYASDPRIGRRAVVFPEEDLGMHGAPVPCRGEPRWTPAFKIFDWTQMPEIVRVDYQADRETGEVTCYFEAQGTFIEHLELHRFPFDRQLLTIRIGTEHRKGKLVFEPHDTITNEVLAPQLSDWTFRPHLYAHFTVDGGNEAAAVARAREVLDHLRAPGRVAEGLKHWAGRLYQFEWLQQCRTPRYHLVTFRVRATRRFEWHLTNVFAFTYIFGLSLARTAKSKNSPQNSARHVLGLLPFMGEESVPDKLGILFTVSLTFTVYKTWMATYLPLIPYWTRVDYYMNGTLYIFVVFAILTVVSLGDQIMRYIGGVFAGFWSLWHLVAWVWVRSGRAELTWDKVAEANQDFHLDVVSKGPSEPSTSTGSRFNLPAPASQTPVSRRAPPMMQTRDAAARAAARAAQAGGVQPNMPGAVQPNMPGAVQPTHRNQGPPSPRDQDATRDRSTIVQGGSLRTWSQHQPLAEREVSLGTDGRPLDAVVEVWDNAGDTPVSMHVSGEDGHQRPVHAVIGGYGTPNTVAVKNTGPMEFPLAGSVAATGSAPPAAKPRPSAECYASSQTIQGDGMERTYPFDWTVESIQILLRSEGMPISATIEVIQGPNTNKQVIELYSNNGHSRPIFYVLETPGPGCVVEITNTGPMEYPLTASCVPHAVDCDPDKFGHGAVIGGDDRGGYGRVRGGGDAPWADRDTVY